MTIQIEVDDLDTHIKIVTRTDVNTKSAHMPT